jgi:hypothetical protein
MLVHPDSPPIACGPAERRLSKEPEAADRTAISRHFAAPPGRTAGTLMRLIQLDRPVVVGRHFGPRKR